MAAWLLVAATAMLQSGDGTEKLHALMEKEKNGFEGLNTMTSEILKQEAKTKAQIAAMEQTEFFGGKKKPSSLLQTGDATPSNDAYWDTNAENKQLKDIGDKFQKELGSIKFDKPADGNEGAAGFQHLTGASFIQLGEKDAPKEKPLPPPFKDDAASLKPELSMVDESMKRMTSLSAAAQKRAADVAKWAKATEGQLEGKVDTAQTRKAQADLEAAHEDEVRYEAKLHQLLPDTQLAGPSSLLQATDDVEAGMGEFAVDPSLFTDPKLTTLVKAEERDKEKSEAAREKVKDLEDKLKNKLGDMSTAEHDRESALEAKIERAEAQRKTMFPDSKITKLNGDLKTPMEVAASMAPPSIPVHGPVHSHSNPYSSSFMEMAEQVEDDFEDFEGTGLQHIDKLIKTPMFKYVADLAAQPTGSLIELGLNANEIATIRGLTHALSKKPHVQAMDDELAQAEQRLTHIQSKVSSELSALNKKLAAKGDLPQESSLIEEASPGQHDHFSQSLAAQKKDLEKTHAITQELKEKMKAARKKIVDDFKRGFAQFGVTYDENADSDSDAHDDETSDDSDSLLQETAQMRTGA